jgi:hypothetical protein
MSQKTNKASNGNFKNRAPEATGSDDAPATQHSSTLEEIQRRAYQIYLSRGAADGQDLKDWLQAERDLRQASASKTTAPA